MKKSFLFLADGFEEVEALGTVDVLRRGTIEVKTVSISDKKEVTGAHGISVVADLLLNDVKEEEAEFLICPGGMPGAKNLGDCSALVQLIQKHYDKGGYVAAICAAPALVLSKIKMNKRHTMTCYPGFEGYLPDADMQPHGVVVDGNVITGRGPAYAFKFGLAILEQITSKKVAEEVAAGMLLD
ncbi:MAG: DJ-1/PfpI family protein [Sanguibacteroides justesenii]|jgi:DJ-1 family protein|uniref:DJ-1 family glyoxalase III n=1 Tax=Butyricimonas faecalis TaxID=2093856 RepID=UPI001DD233C8|nr:DJ-1/PfpI family protein [Sanguibacteroides justesenii]